MPATFTTVVGRHTGSYTPHFLAGLIIAQGALLILFGLLGIRYAIVTTMATFIIIGVLLLLVGILEALHALSMGTRRTTLLHLLTAAICILTAFVFLLRPDIAAEAATLVIASFLMVTGVLRIGFGALTSFHHRFWSLMSGIINVLLALVILSEWPFSGLWVIGVFIGVDMLFNGIALVVAGMLYRGFTSANDDNLPGPGSPQQPSAS